jgi:hypothetical protein
VEATATFGRTVTGREIHASDVEGKETEAMRHSSTERS